LLIGRLATIGDHLSALGDQRLQIGGRLSTIHDRLLEVGRWLSEISGQPARIGQILSTINSQMVEYQSRRTRGSIRHLFLVSPS